MISKPAFTNQNWLRNQSPLSFLMTWEKVHNKNFKVGQISYFIQKAIDNRKSITPQNFIDEMGTVGLLSKSDRNGGTFAHSNIELDFCLEFSVNLNRW